MKVTFNPAASTARSARPYQAPSTQVAPAPMQNGTQNVAFGGWFNDATYYFAKKLDDKREAKKQAQFEKVRQTIHDDIKFMAERQGISLAAAKQRYEDNLDLVAIPLAYNGNESGLNKVVGYSLEKYKAMMEIVLPLMAAKEGNSEYPVPNGALLYGPAYTGKTHFVNALGEHIRIKGAGEFRQYYPGSEVGNDNAVPLLDFIENAEKRFEETGVRQVLFFDNVDDILDEESPNIKGVFLAKIENCAKNGITWIGTVNNPDGLPEILFKPSRLNCDIPINKMSDGEKSAVMSYFWTQRNRTDESDHSAILNENKVSGFHFYPPEIQDVSIRVNDYLWGNEDRDSHLDSRIKVRKPVTTPLVNTQIDNYLHSGTSDQRDLDTVVAVQADSYIDYVRTRRAKYAK